MTQPKTVLKYVAALGLWLATIGIGVADIYYLREIFFGIYARLSHEVAPALFWGNLLVVFAAIGLVVFIVMSSEYHRRRLGKHESWDLFAWSLVVELAIPFIAVFVV